LLLYLDLNCFNRPFDDQRLARVAAEAAAVFRILGRVIDGQEQLAWSDVLDFENSKHPLADRRVEIGRWAGRAAVRIQVEPEVAALAREIARVGVSPLDAAHLACAEIGGCKAFITCDDRLIRRAGRLGLALAVLTPVQYVERYENG
jgi:PIN domain